MTVTTPLRCYFHRMDYVAEVTTSVVGGASSANPLPGTTIVPPGVYAINGQMVFCFQEGLYRVTNFAGFTVQFIVYAKDIDALLSAISRMHQQGDADGSATVAQMTSITRTRAAKVTCGIISAFAVSLLQGVGLQARLAPILSVGPYNGYDDGHILTEVMIGGKWCAFCPTTGNDFWIAGTGPRQRASVLDMHYGIASDAVILRPLITAAELSPDASFSVAALIVGINAAMVAWFTRMVRVPYFQNGSAEQFLADTAADSTAAQSYSPAFVQIPTATYISTYYPSAAPPPPPSGTVTTGEPPNTTTSWGSSVETVVDRSYALPPGSTVSSLGIFFNGPQTGLKMKIMQELSPTSFDDVAETAPQNHPGGGYADFALSFTVPTTGGPFRVAMSCAIVGSEAFSSIGNRSQAVGDLPAGGVGNTATLVNHTDGTLCTRWTS